MRRSVVAAAVGLALILTACCCRGPEQESSPKSELEVNRSLWNALDIRDYRIVFERQNLNGMGNPSDGVFTALVADGLLTSCIVEPPRNFEVCDLLIESTPVETLFDWVDGYEPAYTSVRYDDRLGIPLSIQFDDPDWLDEEYVITVTDFSHGG